MKEEPDITDNTASSRYEMPIDGHIAFVATLIEKGLVAVIRGLRGQFVDKIKVARPDQLEASPTLV